MYFLRILARLGALLLLLVGVGTASAITMEFVEIGDPGNPPTPPEVKKKDWNGELVDNSTGYGSVGYVYRMSKYETTNDQYAAFLNAVAKTDTYGLWRASMFNSIYGGIRRWGSAGNYSYTTELYMGNKPVNFVSWYDCARFANWMHNGQPSGLQDATTTEDGAYTFSGPEVISGRNPGALYYLPDEHEWDKAAFYEAGADASFEGGWWRRTSGSDVLPTPATADEFGNVSNPGRYTVVYQKAANWNGSTAGNVTTVGSSGNLSPYGVADMSGNVFEWVLADPTKPDPNGWGPYTVRGGSFDNQGHQDIFERNLVHHDNHNKEAYNVGFRLAAAALEPVWQLADFNHDSLVDGTDLEIWQTAYDIDAGGDANGDGLTDGRDFLIWQQEFNAPPENPELIHATIPEPTSLLMLLGCISLTLCRRRLAY